MQNFKITYRPHESGSREYQSQIVAADDVDAAIKLLYFKPGSIRSISVQCNGTTKNGSPCQRFTQNDYCCEAHDPRRARFETSLDLDRAMIVYKRFKGDVCYGEECFDLDEAKALFEKGANVAICPRTTMVDRLIAYDWNIDDLREHYRIEAQERERARSLEYRRTNFRLKVEAREPRHHIDISTISLLVTHNGYQWFGYDMTDDEARVLLSALSKHLSDDTIVAATYDINGKTVGGDE